MDAYSRLGIPALGLTKASVEDFGREKAVRIIKDAGLKVASYSGLGPLTGVDASAVKANVEAAERLLDTAAELGAACQYVVTGPKGDLDWEEAAARFKDCLAQVLPIARERNVPLAIEPVHPMRQDLTFVNTAADAFDLAESMDDSLVGYVFDFYHLWWSRDIFDVIRRSVNRIFTVQVSDQKRVTMRTMDRANVGEGVMPLPALVRALETAGYRGWYDMEVISDDNVEIGPDTTIERSIAGFDRVWSAAHT